MGNVRISLRDISFTYLVRGFSPTRALSGVSVLDIVPGEIVCVIGPNGSGKSTLLDVLAGTLKLRPDQGTIEVAGAAAEGDSFRLVCVPQKPLDGLVPELSILENIVLRKALVGKASIVGRAIDKAAMDRVAGILCSLGCEHLLGKLHMPPVALSGGEQQIINLLSAVYAEPDIIVLDEPTSKLDERNRAIFWNLLVQVVGTAGSAVLCASHDLDMVSRVADRVVTLKCGRTESERRIREPLSPRSLPEIRYADAPEDLPESLRNVPTDWWQPSTDGLFGDLYFQGDDSLHGHLAGKPLSRDERTIREVKGVIRLCAITCSSETSVLDVPCGWGRHSLELAQRGCSVVGVDLCDSYLKQARRAATARGLGNVTFKKGDMRDIPVGDASCDVVTNMWTSFGFFNDQDNLRVLREFSRVLRPNGLVLVHSDLNPDRIREGIFDELAVRELSAGGTLDVREYYCASTRRVYGIWAVPALQRVQAYQIAVYSEAEWKAIAEAVGLTLECIYGSFDESDRLLTARSQEFIVVLRKQQLSSDTAYAPQSLG